MGFLIMIVGGFLQLCWAVAVVVVIKVVGIVVVVAVIGVQQAVIVVVVGVILVGSQGAFLEK